MNSNLCVYVCVRWEFLFRCYHFPGTLSEHSILLKALDVEAVRKPWLFNRKWGLVFISVSLFSHLRYFLKVFPRGKIHCATCSTTWSTLLHVEFQSVMRISITNSRRVNGIYGEYRAHPPTMSCRGYCKIGSWNIFCLCVVYVKLELQNLNFHHVAEAAGFSQRENPSFTWLLIIRFIVRSARTPWWGEMMEAIN